MRILITGGAGFIGSHFVRYILEKHQDYDVVVLDKLTYAGRTENLHNVLDSVRFIHGDVCLPADVDKAMDGCNVVFNFAAESHVDRSITGAGEFVNTNVWGTYVLLEAARRHRTERFIQISTDEVYWSCLNGSFREDDVANPSSPYAASKASADLLSLSYVRTYGLPVVITRSSNNFGPYQYPEKVIPLFITNAIEGKPLPVYGDGRNIRDWIYVQDNCGAIDFISQNGTPGEIYNIAATNERENLEIVDQILQFLKKPRDLIQFVQDRPAHDRRYSLDVTKMTALGWICATPFEKALVETVEWYQNNEWWWKPLRAIG
jgi:dTDP-glucose 4,6-dehydratase